jgi:hypothetical protein
MAEFRDGTHQFASCRIHDDSVYVTLVPHRTWVMLQRIESFGCRGAGSRTLDWLCTLADKHGVRISGIARAVWER